MTPRHVTTLVQWFFALLSLGGLLTGCRKQTSSNPGAVASQPGTKETPAMAGMAAPGDSGVRLDRAAASRVGITFARAANQPVHRSMRLVGSLTYAEPRRAYVNARVNGWVEHLSADYVGKPVQRGDVLLAIYSPELVSAQEEYLAARRLGDSSLVAAARRRLTLWDIPEEELAELERSGKSRRTLELRAPRSGEIAEKMVSDGQAIRAGDNLFLIADRSTLWVDVAVFEMDAPIVRVGTPVSVSVGALPDRAYPGRVTFIQPSVDEKTRSLTARIEVANRDGQLRPGMYATVELSPSSQTGLAIPRDAVLPTGRTNLVFVNRGDGAFVPREVVVGARGDSLVEIRHGLKAGDEVVASATYLLDSESNLAAAMQGLMLQMGMGLNKGGMTSSDTSVRPAVSGPAKKEMKTDSAKGNQP
ncbi:MAG: efflux RND transporter periplasmic adaptor subunit [Gemmatimonadota bacterium]